MHRIATSVGAVLIMLAAAPVAAQQRTFTVTAESANVRAEPRLTSAVVRQVPRGTAMEVVATEGGWVKVTLTEGGATSMTGFVSATLGSIGPTAGGTVSARNANQSAVAVGQRAPFSPVSTMPRHFGVGGVIGGFSFGVGASGRYWTSERAGLDVGFSRYSLGLSDSYSSYKFAVNHFQPGVLIRFGAPQDDEDFIVRPYAGGGIDIYRTTSQFALTLGTDTYREGSSETSFGFHARGGAEVGFRSARRLTVSADLGYYSSSAPFAGLTLGGFAYGFGLHWYLN